MVESLVEALEREHREIDAGIEAYRESAAVESLRQALAALRRHIYLEEEFLFPPLRDAGMLGPIMVMLREHGQLWHGMDALDGLLAGSSDRSPVTAACDSMLEQLEQHNAKEEPIVYPQAERVLPAEDVEHLRAFIGSGQMPPGWVCEAAGGAMPMPFGR